MEPDCGNIADDRGENPAYSYEEALKMAEERKQAGEKGVIIFINTETIYKYE